MSSDIRAKLWNFAYDLLDEPHRSQVIAQITSDPSVAREYVRTMQQVSLLREVSRGGPGDTLDWQANDDNRTNVVFPDPLARDRTRVPENVWGRRLFLLFASALALWLIVTVLYVYWNDNSPVRSQTVLSTWDRYAEHFPRMLVTGPVELSPGVAASYQVLLQRIDGPPVNTRVSAELRDANEKIVWHSSRPTNAGGMIRFDVPPLLSPGYYQLSFDTPEIAPPFPLTELSQTTPFVNWLPLRPAQPLIWSSVVARQSNTKEWLLERRVDLSQLWPDSDVAQWKELWEQQHTLPVLARITWNPLNPEPSAETTETTLEKNKESPVATINSPPQRSSLKRAAQRPTKRWLVESLRYESGRVMNRFIIPHSAELPTVFDNEDATAALPQAWFDYSTVPPLHSAVGQTEPQRLPLQKLRIEIERESVDSAMNETAKIRVLNEQGHALPYALAIMIDDRTELDERTMPRAWQQSNLQNQLRLNLPPLVFDNRLLQQNHLENAFEAWCIDRDARRQFVALQVLIASGLGYVLILFGSLLKYLPRVIVWLPAMLIFGVGFAMGTYWLTITDPPPPVVEPSSLMNYGVRSEKPEDEELTSLVETQRVSAVVDALPVDINKQEPIELPTFAIWQSCFEHISHEQLHDNRWEFSAHEWMNNRWKQNQPIELATTVNKDDQLLIWHPFVYTNQQGEVRIQLPHMSKARPLRITVEAVGWHSLGVLQTMLPPSENK